MNFEYFGEGGKSLKRLIPFVLIIVMIIELIISFMPFVVISDNNLQVIIYINGVFGAIVMTAFAATAIEKFSKGRNRTQTPTTTETEGETQ